MNQQGPGSRVLASFPDLNESPSNARGNEKRGLGLLASSGRLIGQATSIKLLAGMVLFLMVGAVLPFCIGKNCEPADATPASDSVATWHSESPETSPGILPETAPAQSATIVQTASRRPPVRISATTEPSSAPAMIPPLAASQSAPQARPTLEQPLSSKWPNPALVNVQPTEAGTDTKQVGANRPMAIGPSERQADARAGQWPQQPTAAKPEGAIETPVIRNRYDSTRPSVY